MIMKGKLYGATHSIGNGTVVSGTEDVTKIHRTISEGLVGLMTSAPGGNVEVVLRDRQELVIYRLTVARSVSDGEILLRLARL